MVRGESLPITNHQSPFTNLPVTNPRGKEFMMAKILIVDDDEDVQQTHRMVLEADGFEVCSAYNAEEGIEKIQSEKPDLVVLDVLMPRDYEGFEVARKVREDLKLRELPILMLSAVHHVKKVPYRFAPDDVYLPVDFFLDKPVEPKDLVERIREMLGE